MSKVIKRILAITIAIIIVLSTCKEVPIYAEQYSLSQEGFDFIKSREGCRLTAYKLEGEQYYTIGYGHFGADVTAGMTITQAQAESLFRQDIAPRVSSVNSFLSSNNIKVTQSQFDALVSLQYNSGNGWKSSSVATILLNGSNKYSSSEILNAFLTCCVNVAESLKQGLLNRRKAEAELFLSDGNVNNSPNGNSDNLAGGENCVNISGWAFDPDNTNSAVTIHVQINRNLIGVCYADKERNDVNDVYGCGAYHGYAASIPFEVLNTGEYLVEVYALDLTYGAEAKLLESKTVTIYNDLTGPEIKNVKVTDVSETGYTITCNVSDKNGVERVQFPTWTAANGQDDLDLSYATSEFSKGIIEGDFVSYRVNVSDHNSDTGLYNTHIYAYDNYGNKTMKAVSAVVENSELVPTKSVTYNGHRYELYDDISLINPHHWTYGKTYCESVGGHLVTIESADEQDVINKLIENAELDGYWIGGTDEASEGNWEWITGENFEYTNWSSNQPDNTNGTQNYLSIRLINNLWDDETTGRISVNYGFICEYDSVEEPMPTPTVVPTSTPTNDPVIKFTLGDVNNDGDINAADALLVLKHAAKIVELEYTSKLAGNVTKDSEINASDALKILKYAAKIIENFD